MEDHYETMKWNMKWKMKWRMKWRMEFNHHHEMEVEHAAGGW